MRKRCFLAFALIVLLGGGVAFADGDHTEMSASEVEEGLTCQCGCGLTVHSCNHLQCSFAVPTRKDIAESLARGESGEAILERYKREYGEKVLSSPMAQGFNLLAWVAPYTAIFVVGLLMVLLFRRRVGGSGRVGTDGTPATGLPSSPETDERRERLRKEVEDLER